jgi:hypothetical protein
MRLPSKTQVQAKAKILFSLALVVAMLAVAAKLASAPLYRRYDARQCREAYAAARTRDDSSRVDLHPYGARHESRNGRCGEVRATVVDSLVLGRPSASR